MIDTLERIKELVGNGNVRISDHGYDELAADNLFVLNLVDGLRDAELLEDYPDFPKGPCALVLQKDSYGKPVHAVWGIPKGETSPAVLITAYRPDPAKWADDFRSRRR
jgi:hypothetical protein